MEKFAYPSSFLLDSENAKEKEYDEKLRLTRNIHKGQVKLFCNELLFILNHVYDGHSDKSDKLIIYVGAGPGHHIPLLVKMFPELKWHLYDCRFNDELRRMKQVELFERYFDDKDVKKYIRMKKTHNIYFISDIRDLSYNPKKQTLDEEMKIFNDMDTQKKWVQNLEAKYSMIKFRPPFPVPHVLEYLGKDYIEYLPGLVYKQPFSKITSVETRLVIEEKECNNTKRYYLKKYESQMFYHNAIYRNMKFLFPLEDISDGAEIKSKDKIDNRYDFAYIITILYHYFMRLKKEEDKNIMKKITKVLKILWDTKE